MTTVDDDRMWEAFAGDVTRTARMAPAQQVRARGDRRRLATLSTVVAAGIVLVAGGTVVAGASQAPIGPAATPSPGATSIPSQFRLAHEGQAGFQLSTDRSAPSALLPCPPEDATDPTLIGRTDAHTVTGREGSVSVTEQLLLFRDESAASDAAYALSQASQRCHWSYVMVDSAPGPHDRDVLAVWRLVDPAGRTATSDVISGQEEGTVLHRGNALWLTLTASTEVGGGPVFLPERNDVRAQLCSLLGLCVS